MKTEEEIREEAEQQRLIEEFWKRYDAISDELFVQISRLTKDGKFHVVNRETNNSYSDGFDAPELAAEWLINNRVLVKSVIRAEETMQPKPAKPRHMRIMEAIQA